jgi:hypothetical protein
MGITRGFFLLFAFRPVGVNRVLRILIFSVLWGR